MGKVPAVICAVFSLLSPGFGQVAPESYRTLVRTRMQDTRVRLRDLSDMFARQKVQYAKLNLTLSDKAAQSSAWEEIQTDQSGIENGVKEFSAQAKSSIAADEACLNGVVELKDHQSASLQLARTTAQTIATLIQLMERQATAAKALPQPDRAQRFAFIDWSIAFHNWEWDLDTTVHALEDAGKSWRNRVSDCCL